jgi:hypothetical protein
MSETFSEATTDEVLKVRKQKVKKVEAVTAVEQLAPLPDKKGLFAGLRASIADHSGKFLKIRDGQSVIVTVKIDPLNADPEKRTPKEIQVDNYKKDGKVWKLRLDVVLPTGSEKIFDVRSTDKETVLRLLESEQQRFA